VAPIPLANGSTFTEYCGVTIFGDVDPGTQISGTITLSLTYEYEAPPGHPVPRFTYTPTDPLFNETVTFNASASYHPNGTIETYTWDFGDGTTGAGMIVNHTYTMPALYTVILNVTDSEGRSLTASKFVRVTVAAAPPPAEFPWLWVGVGVVVVVVVAVGVVAVKRRRRK
jgi:PKD repeat protein